MVANGVTYTGPWDSEGPLRSWSTISTHYSESIGSSVILTTASHATSLRIVGASTSAHNGPVAAKLTLYDGKTHVGWERTTVSLWGTCAPGTKIKTRANPQSDGGKDSI
ncbi:MAG TPA: hypothetical protein HA366_02245 [Candidatus Methanomethylophilaceae archaeon]|nr:hypothetical protein [Candidatus Methanomethylophilaceae archaeon]